MLTAAMQRIEISDRIEMKSFTAEKCSLPSWAQAHSSAPLHTFEVQPSDAPSRAAAPGPRTGGPVPRTALAARVLTARRSKSAKLKFFRLLVKCSMKWCIFVLISLLVNRVLV